MSNQLYSNAREAFATALLDWSAGGLTIKACLVDTGTYTFSAAHIYQSSLSGVIAAGVAITTRTATGGACDGDDVTFTSVSGTSIEAIVIYDDTGSPATSRLIAYIDTATGLPITPNGGDIIVVWDSGTNKIFRV